MKPSPVWPVFRHATLDSTSDEARRMVEAGVGDLPFVVRADRQTRGRGRGANAWWSDEGSLLFTVALDPRAFGLETRHEPRLALVAALAIIEASGLPLGIRWPNDVESGGRKVAGILPERVETAAGVRLLIGVGINVTTRFDGAPEDVREMATSLGELEGKTAEAGVTPCSPSTLPSPSRGEGEDSPGPSLWSPLPLWERVRVRGSFDEETAETLNGALLTAFLASLAPLLPALAQDDPGLVRRWNGRDQLAGRRVQVRQADRIIAGIGRGIGAEGALLLETDRGLETIVGGQVLRP